MPSPQPIGVYDSGLGGLSVARAIRDALPGERLRTWPTRPTCPTAKTTDYVRRRAETISDYFVERDAKAIVVACNTATAAAIADLRARHPA